MCVRQTRLCGAALFDALPTESHKIGIILDKADSYMYRNKRICKDTFRAGQMAAEECIVCHLNPSQSAGCEGFPLIRCLPALQWHAL